MLDIATGAIKSTVPTNKGNTTTPAGLGQVRAWVDLSDLNNLALRAYGGDMLGNVYRFDIDNNLGPAGNEAQVIATVQGSSGNVQPITAKPELGLVKTTKANGDAVTYPMVYIGTGRYFGVSDLTDTSGQSIYGIKDNLAQTSYGNPRAAGNNFVQQTLTATTCPVNTPNWICGAGQLVRTSTKNAVDLNTQNGWFVDLPDTGERINTDPQLALGTLTVTSNIPNATACTIGGYSFVYFFDYTNGWPVSTSPTNVTGVSLGNALATRPVVVKLPNGKVISVIQQSNGVPATQGTPVSGSQNPTRRVSWRELVTE
ncbi:MAG: hypothetical protein HYZ45_03795 [Burkholderiales bacterium]|nr:hypothetical protein [Burkholderiales bacterium]